MLREVHRVGVVPLRERILSPPVTDDDHERTFGESSAGHGGSFRERSGTSYAGACASQGTRRAERIEPQRRRARAEDSKISDLNFFPPRPLRLCGEPPST